VKGQRIGGDTEAPTHISTRNTLTVRGEGAAIALLVPRYLSLVPRYLSLVPRYLSLVPRYLSLVPRYLSLVPSLTAWGYNNGPTRFLTCPIKKMAQIIRPVLSDHPFKKLPYPLTASLRYVPS